jgi:hypothetical protein
MIHIAKVDVIDISYDIDRTYFYWCFNMVATCDMVLPYCKQFLQLVPMYGESFLNLVSPPQFCPISKI